MNLCDLIITTTKQETQTHDQSIMSVIATRINHRLISIMKLPLRP